MKNETKSFRCEIRMTDEERSVLDYLTEKKETTKTDIVNKALKMMYNLEKFT